MPSPSALNGLIPLLLRRQLSDSGAGPHHEVWRFPAAMLIADVSGFTSLAERLAARGPEGVEELSRLVNRWFGAMVDVIAGHGGDVIRFAGDAPIAAFPAAGSDGDLGMAVRRAHACGESLQATMQALNTAESNVSVRVGIGAGEVTAVVAGGVDGRWEFVLGGRPVDQMSDAERRAARGSIALSPEAAALLHTAPASDAAPEPLDASELDERNARPFVPPAALRFVDAGQTAWTAELRQVTVLFLGIAGLDLDAPDGPGRLHDVLGRLQTSLFRQGGSLTQFLVDDKGLTLLASWGVPGHRHEDDAARAVRASWACEAALAGTGTRIRGGLATGRVFCGWRGNERRREYALIGAVVNRAARLMTATSDAVLCDEATARAGSGAGRFEDAGLLTLKGSAQPARAYSPVESGPADRAALVAASAFPATEIVGRRAERALLADALAALGTGTSSAVVVSGDAGMGKSTLVASFVEMARTAAVTLGVGSVDSASASSAYLPWRGVLGAIVGLDDVSDPAARLAAVKAALSGRPGASGYAPLLAEVLGVSAPETDETSRLAGQTRVERTRDLVVDLLQQAAAAKPLVVVLDNVHWMDSLSIALAQDVRRRVAPLLLVLVTRPLGPDAPPDAIDLVSGPTARVIDLARLAPEDVRLLICRRLGVTHVPDELTAIVEEKSAGYPLFVAELARSLLEAGVIQTSGSACVLVDAGAKLRSHRFPDSVQGAIADRLDRLSVAEQLTMKVAAAAGAPFDAETIAAVHPLTPGPNVLRELLAALVERGFLVGRDGVYRFGHAVMQDVAYGMMLSDQRRSLHGAIAGWYEREGRRSVPAAVMAHHWTEAGNGDRSLLWLERAGEEASRLGAMREVLRHFGRAFEIAGQPEAGTVEPLRRVRWLRLTGHAHSELGATGESTRLLVDALSLLGRRLPGSSAAMGARLGRESLRQLALLTGVLRAPARFSAAVRQRVLEEAEVLRLLGKLAFYAQDHLRYIAVSLQSINLAERAGARETAASAYAALGYVVAMLGLERLAERWWRLADESGELDAQLNMLIGRMLFLNSQARWDESSRAADAQQALIARAGTSASLPSHLMMSGYIHLHHGRYDRAREAVGQWLDWCLSANHLQQAFSARLQMADVLLEQGRLEEVWHQLAEADALSGNVTDPMFLSIYRGVAVEAHLAAGDLAGARAAADALREVVAASSPYFGEMMGYVALTEYSLARHAAAVPGSDAAGHLRDARWAHGALARHARLNPYARPRTWLLDGRIAAAAGRPARAHRSWQRALALAERYDMPREIARAHADLGHDVRLAAEDRRAHLIEARSRFERMGSPHRVAEVDRVLQTPAAWRLSADGP